MEEKGLTKVPSKNREYKVWEAWVRHLTKPFPLTRSHVLAPIKEVDTFQFKKPFHILGKIYNSVSINEFG